mgnify:CR=1 FL=1
METEKQLLEAIHSGEKDAMRRLYDRYSGYAMAIALRYVPERDEVRDVLQDSFVKILTTIGQFEYRGEGTLKSWVARIVSHQAIDHLRAHSRIALTDNLPDIADEEDEAEPDFGNLATDALLTLIGRLPANYRTVLNLFVFEQWSHREIAELLGIKENTSSSIFSRAKRMLSIIIKEELAKR